MTFLVTYIPTNSTGRNESLLSKIKQYKTWAILNSTNYIVKAEGKKAKDIRDELVLYIPLTDKLLVTELTGNAAWRNLGDDMSRWLKNNLQ